jgi:hypothetical protein
MGYYRRTEIINPAITEREYQRIKDAYSGLNKEYKDRQYKPLVHPPVVIRGGRLEELLW